MAINGYLNAIKRGSIKGAIANGQTQQLSQPPLNPFWHLNTLIFYNKNVAIDFVILHGPSSYRREFLLNSFNFHKKKVNDRPCSVCNEVEN